MAKNKSEDNYKYNQVLLIDDDQIDNFINERMVTTTNFAKTVSVYNNAPAALIYLEDLLINSKVLPEVIFLDLNMPVMNGFQFLEEYDKLVKIYPNMALQCRVIVLSSSISETDINRASINPYVFRYINKPLSEKYLNAIVI
ncbi:MAG: response regulator [Bacteroidota bacterium]|nr:response regulator [Bacteroidota bacterium]